MRVTGGLIASAVLFGLVAGNVAAAAPRRSGDSLPKAQGTVRSTALPKRAVPELAEANQLIGLPLLLGVAAVAAVSITIAVASAGDNDSEG